MPHGMPSACGLFCSTCWHAAAVHMTHMSTHACAHARAKPTAPTWIATVLTSLVCVSRTCYRQHALLLQAAHTHTYARTHLDDDHADVVCACFMLQPQAVALGDYSDARLMQVLKARHLCMRTRGDCLRRHAERRLSGRNHEVTWHRQGLITTSRPDMDLHTPTVPHAAAHRMTGKPGASRTPPPIACPHAPRSPPPGWA